MRLGDLVFTLSLTFERFKEELIGIGVGLLVIMLLLLVVVLLVVALLVVVLVLLVVGGRKEMGAVKEQEKELVKLGEPLLEDGARK